MLAVMGAVLVGYAATPGRGESLGPVMAAAISIDGRTMAVSTVTTDVALFDIEPLTFRTLLTSPEGTTLSWREASTRHGATSILISPPVAFSPDGKLLVAAGARGELVGWDLASRAVRFRAPSITGTTGLAFLPDGRSFVTAGTSVTQWSAENGAVLGEFKSPGAKKATSVAVSPDGTTVLVGLYSGEIAEFEASTRQLRRVLKGHRAPVTGLAFSPDGSEFASAAARFDPRLWKRGEETPVRPKLPEISGTGETQALMLFAWLLGSAAGYRIVGAPTTGMPPIGSTALEVPQDETYVGYCATKVAYSPDGRFLAATARLSLLSGEFQLILVDLSGQVGRVIHGIRGCSVAFAPNSKLVITGGSGAPELWDPETGTRLDSGKPRP